MDPAPTPTTTRLRGRDGNGITHFRLWNNTFIAGHRYGIHRYTNAYGYSVQTDTGSIDWIESTFRHTPYQAHTDEMLTLIGERGDPSNIQSINFLHQSKIEAPMEEGTELEHSYQRSQWEPSER